MQRKTVLIDKPLEINTRRCHANAPLYFLTRPPYGKKCRALKLTVAVRGWGICQYGIS
jgi:hypothetical protein